MKVVKGLLVSLAVLGFCLPQPVLAATVSTNPEPLMADVTLSDGGVLLGQVVDQQGKGLAKLPLTLRDQSKILGTAETNEQGYFAFRSVTSGVYQIVSTQGYGAYRVWTPQAAPPSSQKGALLVAGNGAVRGNLGNSCLAFITNPWFVLGVVATAIAVPVAISAADNPSSP